MNNYNDQAMSINLLCSLKHLKTLFDYFTQEVSNEELYDEIFSVYENISQLQRDVYEMMKSQNWYQIKSDSSSNISKAYTKFSNKESELQ